MNPSRIFIERPVATLLLTFALLLVGILGFRELPISALPEVDYPVIQVMTQFPGAGPEVMTRGVTAPLERQLGQMPGLQQMLSVSSGGVSVITLKFNLEVSLDVAEQEVQAAINAADSLLPADLPNKPTYKKVNPADTPILTLAATSDTLPLTRVQDLINTRAALKLSQITGIGLVSLAGGQQTAVRIRVDPQAIAAHGLSLEDINSAVNGQNVNASKGSFDGEGQSITIDANDQLTSPNDYAEIILAYENGNALRLKDVAMVEEAPQDLYQEARVNGMPAIIINIQRQPGTNVVSVADTVKARLPQIQSDLPDSVKLEIVADRTQTIRAAIADVEKELCISILLVVFVSYIFLRNAAATFIPSLAVPLSIVGSFAVMYLADFSLNNLTLMSLTIATGFVIDDAIVVVENIQRHVENGMPPLAAALKGSQEIGFTIISLTISLVAVLIPLLFMGDVTGRLFREFSVTLAVAIFVSMIISLTLTPMLGAYLLRRVPKESEGPAARRISAGFDRTIAIYERALRVVLNHQAATVSVAAATLALTGILFSWLPQGFFPEQDTGIIQGITRASKNVSFDEMMRKQNALASAIEQDPAVEAVTSVVGADAVNNNALSTGRLQIVLKEFDERDAAAVVIARLKELAATVPGIVLFALSSQDLNVDDQVTPSRYQVTLSSVDLEELEIWVPKMESALEKRPEFADVETDLGFGARVLRVDIERSTAMRYGITASDIAETLYNAYGQRLISTIYTQANQYRVVLEVAPDFRTDARGLEELYVKGSDGAMVPLSSLIRITYDEGYSQYSRLNQSSAATLSYNLAPGFSIEDGLQALEAVQTEIALPATVTVTKQGTLAAYSSSSTNTLWLILAAVVTMYIVLGVLYESFIHPVTVLSTLPSAAIGAFLALKITNTEFTLIALIGLILLIGIVKKNAIMLIDFALQEKREGKAPVDAIYNACLLRFRPILMTTCAALLGALPLMLATGSGAELRRPLGLVIVSGLLLSQLITLFTTPVLYLVFENLKARLMRRLGA